jgi:hypothetical protein
MPYQEKPHCFDWWTWLSWQQGLAAVIYYKRLITEAPQDTRLPFLDLQLFILVVLRESKMEPAAFRPINFHGIAGLEVFHSPTCSLVLA